MFEGLSSSLSVSLQFLIKLFSVYELGSEISADCLSISIVCLLDWLSPKVC
jgi:hypothetical protein